MCTDAALPPPGAGVHIAAKRKLAYTHNGYIEWNAHHIVTDSPFIETKQETIMSIGDLAILNPFHAFG